MEKLKDPLEDTASVISTKHINAFQALFHVHLSQQNLDTIATQAANGTRVAFVGNHQSHADVIPFALIVQQATDAINKLRLTGNYPCRDNFQGFNMPMAASVTSGDQGGLISFLYGLTSHWLEQHHIHPVSIVRGKDAIQYGMNQFCSREDLVNLRRDIFTNPNVGLVIFPEATVTGGRRILGSEQRHGIVPVTKRTLLSDMVIRARENGLSWVVVPVALSGTYKIFDPDTLMPTRKAIEGLAYNLLHPKSRAPLASAKVGMPFSTKEIVIPSYNESRAPAEALGQIHGQVLKKISVLLPSDERGYLG